MHWMPPDLMWKHLVQLHNDGNITGMLDLFERHKITKEDVIYTMQRMKTGDAATLAAYVKDHSVLLMWYRPELDAAMVKFDDAYTSMRHALDRLEIAGEVKLDEAQKLLVQLLKVIDGTSFY